MENMTSTASRHLFSGADEASAQLTTLIAGGRMASGALARETPREFRNLKDAGDEAERSVAKALHMVVLLPL